MPVTTEIDSETGLISYIASGTISLAEMREAYEKVFERPDYRPGMNALCNAKDAQLDVSMNELGEFVSFLQSFRAKRGEGYKLAILVRSNQDFGLTNVFRMRGYEMPVEIQVFRSSNEAKQWLTSP